MNLPDTEPFITPVDDPCQYNPDWRSMVAGYLVSAGVNTEEKLRSVAMTGCIEVVEKVEVREDKSDDAEKPSKKGRKKPKKQPKKKFVQKKTLVPVIPFCEHTEYRSFANDKWIVEQVLLCNERSNGGRTPDRFLPMRLAEVWYEEKDCEAAIKHRLEALLLTEVGIDVITADLVGQPSIQPAIEAYEKMYFNCRDENFEISPSMHLVTRMAMPFGPLKMYLKKWEEMKDGFCVQDGRPIAKDSDIWKAIGATMGYDTLIYVWNWERRASGIKDRSLKHKLECTWHSAVSRIMTSLFTGDMKHEDAARILATCTAQLKFIDDSSNGKGGGDSDDETLALLAILRAAAPKMRVLEEGAAGMITDSEIQGRIEAQQAIDKQGIQDAGKNVAEEIIDAQIANAIDGD